MRRNVFQDFAHVCCQKFLTSLSNSDRINFVLFGSGSVTMDFLSLRCTHQQLAVSPLGYCIAFREWLIENCKTHNLRIDDITEARLEVKINVSTERNVGRGLPGWLSTHMTFDCESRIATNEKVYSARLSESQERGLGQILTDRYY